LWDNDNGEPTPQNETTPKILSIPRKRPYSQVENATSELRRSMRPKVVHDYKQLNDPSYEEREHDVADIFAEMVYVEF